MKYHLLTTLLFLISNVAFSQISRQDSLDILFSSGRLYNAVGQTQNALDSYLNADRICKEIQGVDAENRYIILYEIGRCYFLVEQPGLAIASFLDALSLADNAQIKNSIIVKLLKSLSTSSNVTGNYEKGLEYARRAYDIQYILTPYSPTDVFDANLVLGSAFLYGGVPDSSIIYYNNALSILKGNKKNDLHGIDTTRIYHELGASYMKTGQTQEAISFLEKAVKMRITDTDTIKFFTDEKNYNILSAHNNLAQAYFNLQRYEDALKVHRKNLRYRIKYSDKKINVATTYNNIGLSLSRLGLYVEALEYYNKAVDEIPIPYDHNRIIGSIYSNIGTVYRRMGNRKRAINFQQRSLSVLSENLSPQATEIAYSLNDLAILQAEDGDFPSAIANINDAFHVLQPKLQKGYPEILTLELNKASLLLKSQQEGEAKKMIYNVKKDAILLIKDFPYLAIRAFTMLGDKRLWPEDLDSARFYNLAAIELQKSSSPNNLELLMQVRGNYARFLQQEGKQKEALNQLLFTNKTMGITGDEIVWNELSLPFDYYSWLPLYISVSIKHLKQNPSKENYFAAQQLINKSNLGAFFLRGRGVAEEQLLVYERQIQELSSTLNFDIREEYIERSKSILEALYHADLAKSRLLNMQLHRAEIERDIILPGNLSMRIDSIRVVRKSLSLLEDKIRRNEIISNAFLVDSIYSENEQLFATEKEWLQELQATAPKYYAARFAEPNWTLAEVRQKLLAPDQAILSYLVTDSTTYTFLLRADTLIAHEQQVNKKYLDTLVHRFVDIGINGYYRMPESLRTGQLKDASFKSIADDGIELYQLLIAPIKEHLPDKITIIPDGSLSILPFSALSSGPPKRKGSWGSYPFLIRDHTISYGFSVTQQLRMQAMEPSGKGWFGLAPFAKNSVNKVEAAENRGIFLNDPLLPLGPLQGSGPEVKGIAKLTGGEIFLSEAANREAFLRVAKGAGILHLATHGVPNERIPQDAYLAFAGVNPTEYDPLRAGEIYGLDVSAEMVVLSACESGVGRILTGEGPQSLERAFAYAGARSLVSSLWPANDSETSDLMVTFYKGLKKGMPRSEALNEAMKSVYLSPRNGAKHPFYWAGWMLRGADGPLELN